MISALAKQSEGQKVIFIGLIIITIIIFTITIIFITIIHHHYDDKWWYIIVITSIIIIFIIIIIVMKNIIISITLLMMNSWPQAGADTLQRLSADNAASKCSRGQQQDHHGIITTINIFTLSCVIRLLASSFGLRLLSQKDQTSGRGGGGGGVREGFGKGPNFYRIMIHPFLTHNASDCSHKSCGYKLRGEFFYIEIW